MQSDAIRGTHLVRTGLVGGAPELPNEGRLDAEHVRTIDEETNRRLSRVPANEHVIRVHQWSSVALAWRTSQPMSMSSGFISGHQWSSVALAWRTSQPMSMSASTVRTSLANVMSNSTCTHMHSHALTCTQMHSERPSERPSEAIREAIREATRSDQRRSEAIRGDQQQSASISIKQPHLAVHDDPFGCGEIAGEQPTVAPY
jgi:hypothetical protein